MPTGTVKWYSSEKGYGFISPDNNTGGRDAFVHRTALARANIAAIHEGQRVEYELERDARTGKVAAVGLRVV
jgi:CspA family cold shock protein